MELHAPTHRLLAQLIRLYILGFTDILPNFGSILVCGALHNALYSRLPGFMRRSDHHLELLCVEDVNISALEDMTPKKIFPFLSVAFQIWICCMFSKIASKFKLPVSRSSQ